MTLIDTLDTLDGHHDALFCDLWGCLHDGIAPFASAVAALQRFRRSGGAVVLLTNAPRPWPAVAHFLHQIGVPDDCHDAIVTSGDAAQAALMAGAAGRRVWHIGPERDLDFFDAARGAWPEAGPIDLVAPGEAEGIVCTGLTDDLTETPEDYRGALVEAQARGLPMLCANPDLVVDRGTLRVPCAGALAALYTRMGGRSLYFGKPHQPIYDLARQRLAALRGEVPARRILCLGDGIGTDIAGAVAQGHGGLLITGGLAAEATGTRSHQPDPDLLAAFLSAQTVQPDWVIGMLR